MYSCGSARTGFVCARTKSFMSTCAFEIACLARLSFPVSACVRELLQPTMRGRTWWQRSLGSWGKNQTTNIGEKGLGRVWIQKTVELERQVKLIHCHKASIAQAKLSATVL